MQRRSLILTGMGLLALAGVLAAKDPAAQPPKEANAQTSQYTISKPFTHKNLTIFLIHGKDVIKGKKFLTLQEALEQKKIVVHETSNVNQLTVENVSPDVEIFIQSGDIIKGGKQDRVLSYDLIISAKSGKVPIAVFCVEAGRWHQRGNESAGSFAASINQVGGKALKLAVNQAQRQDLVWMKIREAQRKLSKKLGKSVANQASPSSLELTLEDKELLQALDEYVKALTKAPNGQKDVIGYALAINGKVEGADIYGSAALFQKLWPKLLQASAVDALAELDPKNKFRPATVDAAKAFLADAAKGKKKGQNISRRVRIVTQETAKQVLIETYDRADMRPSALPGAAAPRQAVHKSYIAK